MGLFTKPVTQVVNLEGGRMLAFTSKKKELAVDDEVTLVGSSEKLNEKVKLENNMVATIENNKVVNMEEEEESKANMDEESYEDLKAKVDDLTESVKEILKKIDGKKEEEETQAKEEEEQKAEQDEKMKNIEEATAQAKTLLDSTLKVAELIKSDFTLDKIEDKHEEREEPEFMKNMSAAQKHAYELKNVINGEEKENSNKKDK